MTKKLTKEQEKVAKEAMDFLDNLHEDNIRRYEEALERGDSMLAKMYLNLIMKLCPEKLKN